MPGASPRLFRWVTMDSWVVCLSQHPLHACSAAVIRTRAVVHKMTQHYLACLV